MPVAMLRHNHLYRCAVLALIFGSVPCSRRDAKSFLDAAIYSVHYL